MSIIHGRNIKIYNASGTALLAAAKSCTIHAQGEAIEKSSETYARDREYTTGRSTWSIDLAYFVTAVTDGILLVNTMYQIRVVVGTSTVLQGYVICTDCDIQATAGNLASGSIKMQGTGPLAAPSS
jgi:predicted secreted protein